MCTNVLYKNFLSYILKKKKKFCIPRTVVFFVINVCNQGKTLWSPCICLLSTAMCLSCEIYMPRVLFAVFTCAQLSLWVSIVHLHTELCPESTHRNI